MNHNTLIENVKCAQLIGKNVDSLEKALNKVKERLAIRSPCILILDDLDVLCPNPFEKDDAMKFYYKQVFVIVSSFLKNIENFRIYVISTCKNKDSIHESFTSVDSNLKFSNMISMPELVPGDRAQFVRSFVQTLYSKHTKTNSNESIHDSNKLEFMISDNFLIKTTDKYQLCDLENLCHRIDRNLHIQCQKKTWCKNDTSKVYVSEELVQNSLEKYCPVFDKGAQIR